MRSSLEAIQSVLSQKSLAVYGVSRNPRKFGSVIFRELKRRGYKVYAVHPQAEELEGARCYRSLAELPEKVGGVIFCVPPPQTEQLVHQVHEAGIANVWLQQGAESEESIRYCQENGMTVVYGQCILLFTEPVVSVHRFHRWVDKMVGRYPTRSGEKMHAAG